MDFCSVTWNNREKADSVLSRLLSGRSLFDQKTAAVALHVFVDAAFSTGKEVTIVEALILRMLKGQSAPIAPTGQPSRVSWARVISAGVTGWQWTIEKPSSS